MIKMIANIIVKIIKMVMMIKIMIVLIIMIKKNYYNLSMIKYDQNNNYDNQNYDCTDYNATLIIMIKIIII